ncbi:glycine zipper domain-containing protein [Flavisolibacter tropicus]|uniref:glycine zipper domain-containing protein n=1 Tax=Flavisolibacter tropicus TaxID=1492898 RepID=UPI00082EE1F0|nr:glycine zipper domain-containing protein [Flavisolibacter tropicus]
MKRLLPILSIAVGLAACNANADKIAEANPSANVQQAPTNTLDTTGFAAFQNMKALNELAAVEQPVQEIQMAATPVKKAAVAHVRKPAKSVASAPKPESPLPAPTPSDNTSSSGAPGSTVATGNGDGAESAGAGDIAKTEEKKGWSKTAKGAVIGGVTGAAAGAILNKKNRAVGAVIGGVIGAGGGAVIGRQMDKKDGRFLTTGTYVN